MKGMENFMKNKNRHISTEKKLIIVIVIVILIFAGLLYLYHNHWNGLYIVDNVPTSLEGVGIIVFMSFTMCTIFVLGITLFVIHFPPQSVSEKQIKNLPNNFVNVQFKDFDKILLSKFVSKDDIFCTAKLDEDGKVNYSFHLKPKIYKTEDYELFLENFDV